MIHLLIPYPILWIFFLKYFNSGFLVFMCLFRPNLILSWGEKQIQCISTKEFRVYLSFFPLNPVAVVRSLNRVWLFATPWTAACQASLSSTISLNLHWVIVWYILVSPLNKQRNGREETRMWFLPSIYLDNASLFIYLFSPVNRVNEKPLAKITHLFYSKPLSFFCFAVIAAVQT